MPCASRWRIIFAGALLGFVLSKGAALVPGYGLDDYAAVLDDRPLWFYFSQGRFTQAALQALMSSMHLSVTAVQWPIILAFIIGGSAALALGLAWVTQGRGNVWAQAAVAALMAAYPYLTEYFWFRESLVTQCASFLLMAAFFASLPSGGEGHGRWRAYVVPVVLLIALAGAQQTAFLVATFFVMARIALDAMQSGPGMAALIRCHRAILLTFIAAGIGYVIMYALSRRLGGPATDQRASLVLLADVPMRVRLIGRLLATVLFEGEPIRSTLSKWLLDIVIIVAVVAAGWRRKSNAAIVLLVFALSLAGSITLVGISREWWPVPRAIYGVGFALGLTLCVAAATVVDGRIARALSASIAVVAFIAAMESASILHDQGRLNRWDMATAHAVAHDVLAATGGKRVPLEISVPSGYLPYSLPPHTAEGDLNLSALQVPWALQRLLSEATGNAWDTTSKTGDPRCEGRAAWPSPGSVTLQEDGKALVCLGGG